MVGLSDALLFKAEKKLMREEKGSGSSMSHSVLAELTDTTFNRHQEHCPGLVFDVDHTNVQSVYIPYPLLAQLIEICAKVAIEGAKLHIKSPVFHYCHNHCYHFLSLQEFLFTL